MYLPKAKLSFLHWWRFGLPISSFVFIMLLPTPEGLSSQGHSALATMILALGLWSTEAFPIGITAVASVII